jgi:hypothetical protein
MENGLFSVWKCKQETHFKKHLCVHLKEFVFYLGKIEKNYRRYKTDRYHRRVRSDISNKKKCK